MWVVLLALLASPSQDLQPREKRGTEIHGLVLPIPATWERKDEAGVVYLTTTRSRADGGRATSTHAKER